MAGHPCAHPCGPQEGHSPHRAQAAVIQLQLAEVGQVHPCGATGRRSEAGPPARSPAQLCTLTAPQPLLPDGFSEAQLSVPFGSQAPMEHAGQVRKALLNPRGTRRPPGRWSPGLGLEEGRQLEWAGPPKLGPRPQPPPKACSWASQAPPDHNLHQLIALGARAEELPASVPTHPSSPGKGSELPAPTNHRALSL